MKPVIKYKIDFDFISYNKVCANLKDLGKPCGSDTKQTNSKKDKEWKKKNERYMKEAELYFSESLSYIQRNELEMFFKKTSIFTDYLMHLAVSDKELEDQTLDDFKRHIFETLEIEEEDLTPEKLLEEVINHYDDPNSIDDYNKETELILETLKDERMFNSIFKNAVSSLKKTFIEKKYLPSKDEYDQKLKEHNDLYQKNPFEFMSNISAGIVKDEDLKRSDLQPYITFLTRFTIMLEVKKDFSILVYHYKMENTNKEEHEKDIMYSLLKFLSDPKRYEMIQMLSKKKWYANELAKKFEITPATMSYHVNKLFALGLISFEQAEQNKLYIELDNSRLNYLLDRIMKDLAK